MRRQKLNSAERLLDAIGDIDPRFIADAESVPEIKRRRFAPPRKWMSIAAGAVAFAFVIFGVSLTLLERGMDFDLAPEGDKAAMDVVGRDPAVADENITLGSLLSSVQSDSSIRTVSEEDITFIGGRMKIIWCYVGDEKYRVVSVPSSRESELLSAIEDLKNAKKTNETGEMPYAIWICFEDGRVITPYLENTAGNVGYAELFEYSPEIEPDSKFTTLINELIS